MDKVAEAELQLGLKKNPRLEGWRVILFEDDPRFVDDEQLTLRLQGRIHGHPNPKFTDGEVIQTLDLLALDMGMKRGATKQTVYDLGEVDPTFLEYVQELGKLSVNKVVPVTGRSLENETKKINVKMR